MPIDFEQWYDKYYDDAITQFAGIDCTDPKGIAEDAWRGATDIANAKIADMVTTIDSIQFILAGTPIQVQGHKDAIEALAKYKEMLEELTRS